MGIFKHILVLLIITFITVGYAQNDVIATGKKNRTITKSSKLNELPSPVDTAIQIPPIKYYLEPSHHEVSFETEPIKAAKLKVREPLDKLYPGYVKIGVGNYTMPYAEAYYNSLRSKKNSWGVHAKHHSALGTINDVGNSQFAENRINGFYKHFFRNHTLKTNLHYHRDGVNRYGFLQSDSTIPTAYRESEDSINLAYNLIGVKSSIQSMYKDSSKLNHRIGLNYYFLNNTDNAREHNVIVSSTLNKYLEGENIEVNTDLEIDFNSLNQSELPYKQNAAQGAVLPDQPNGVSNTAILRVVPYIINNKVINDLHFKAGFGINVDISTVNNFYFYPEVDLSYSLFNDVFIPYAGASGGVIRNSLNNIRIENPFILSNSLFENTMKRNYYGGIRGSISSKWSFNTHIDYSSYQNQALFYNDALYSYQNGFGILYDDVNITTFSGQLTYQNGEKLHIGSKAEFYVNNAQNELHPWLLPTYKIDLNAMYNLADKIIVTSDLFLVGERMTYTIEKSPFFSGVTTVEDGKNIYTLAAYVDANLGIEYRYNKRLSAFVNFNNLAAQRYMEFMNYPVQRFNLLGGLTFKF